MTKTIFVCDSCRKDIDTSIPGVVATRISLVTGDEFNGLDYDRHYELVDLCPLCVSRRMRELLERKDATYEMNKAAIAFLRQGGHSLNIRRMLGQEK